MLDAWSVRRLYQQILKINQIDIQEKDVEKDKERTGGKSLGSKKSDRQLDKHTCGETGREADKSQADKTTKL